MKFPRASGLLGLAAAAIVAAPPASAQDPGLYVGLNFGRSHSMIDEDHITSELLGSAFNTLSISRDSRDQGGKVYLGYRFNRFFDLEGGYFDLGRFGFTSTMAPAGTLEGRIKVQGVNLDLVLHLPFTERFSAFVRGGVANARTEDTFTGTGLVPVTDPNPSKRDTRPKFGLGLQYDFTRHISLRAEAERYQINDAVNSRGDVDLVSLGLLVRMGRKAHAAPPVYVSQVAEPAYVAPAPAVEPKLVIVPVATPTQKYCTILDIQFEVNEDGIQREDREKLAVVGTFMTKYPETTALIEGHTDNVGTDEHNMQLSQSRAENVARYLEDTFHLAPPRFTAVGYGSSQPIADNATEEGKRKNRRIGAVIACASDIEGLTVAPARITMALLMEYDRNKADVKPQYADELRKVATFLNANPTATATVEGHTGNLQATPELAQQISLLRAQNVVDYLVEHLNVQRSRLTAEGFGRGRRIAYNTSVEGQQENRRVNIIINYTR